MTYPTDLKSEVINAIGGFNVGDSLEGLDLFKIIEVLLCGGTLESPYSANTTFFGIIQHKPNSEITIDDLLVDTVELNTVTKPTMTYKHVGDFVFNKAVVIAIPKSFGSITGVIDGLGNSIAGAYTINDKAILNIPGVGEVEYIIGSATEGQIYNQTSVVTWQIS